MDDYPGIAIAVGLGVFAAVSIPPDDIRSDIFSAIGLVALPFVLYYVITRSPLPI